jgi:hypothetical protein
LSVLVLSCGRTGTNIAVEMLMAVEELTLRQREERVLFKHPYIIPVDYLEKSDTVYVPTLQSIKEVMDLNPELKIVWTIRDFRDVVMSKIYRGRPNGDLPIQADDATVEGCEQDLRWMLECYQYASSTYPDRVIVSRMEDVLEDPDSQAKKLCSFLEVTYNSDVQNFHTRMRIAQKKSRYSGVDKTQIGLWRQDEPFDGYFKNFNFGKTLPLLIKESNIKFGYE